jgi:hypothetical protein
VTATKTPESELPWVLDELCVELGFCLPLHRRTEITASPPGTVNAFTDALFEAEGIDPTANQRLYVQVRDKIERRLGQWLATVDH